MSSKNIYRLVQTVVKDIPSISFMETKRENISVHFHENDFGKINIYSY